MNKNLKPVPAEKKKSLGKLPEKVRNKMGYAQKGKMMSNRDKRQKEITEKQNPKSEYKKDKFGKTKLSYTEARKGSMMKARYGTMAKGDVKEGLKKSSEFKRKLEDFKYNAIKRIRGAKAGPAEEAKLNEMMPSVKDSPSTRKSKMKAVKMKLSKLKTGGEMKKGYGAARTSGMGLQDEDLIPGKSMDYYKDLM